MHMTTVVLVDWGREGQQCECVAGLAEVPLLSAESFEQFGCLLRRCAALCDVSCIDGSRKLMFSSDVLEWATELSGGCGGGRVADWGW